jgi:hypothetical protein
MFNRRVRLLLNGIAMSAMLFAHVVAAAQACTAASDSPAIAFSDMNCADMPSQNVCLQQYLAGDQTPATPQVPPAVLPDIAVLTVPVAVECIAPLPDPGVSIAHSGDPPSSIRFCSLQL